MSKWQKRTKISIYEQIDKPIFIFCGAEQTEPNYFNGFKTNIESNAIYKNVVKIEIIKEPSDTIRILDRAIEYVNENNITKGDIWCVFDKDDFLPQDFNNAIYKAESLNNDISPIKYYIAWSNECFELWFLLHFCYYSANNGRQDYIDKLNSYFIKNNLEKYAKNNINLFNIMITYGNPKEAIANAKKLEVLHQGKTPAESVPCTNVHQIVLSILQYLPNEIRNKFI